MRWPKAAAPLLWVRRPEAAAPILEFHFLRGGQTKYSNINRYEYQDIKYKQYTKESSRDVHDIHVKSLISGEICPMCDSSTTDR